VRRGSGAEKTGTEGPSHPSEQKSLAPPLRDPGRDQATPASRDRSPGAPAGTKEARKSANESSIGLEAIGTPVNPVGLQGSGKSADRVESGSRGSGPLAEGVRAARGEAHNGAATGAESGRNGGRARMRRAGAVKASHSGAMRRRGSAIEEAGRRGPIRGLVRGRADRLVRSLHSAADARAAPVGARAARDEVVSGAQNEAECEAATGRNGSRANRRRADLRMRRGSRSALKASGRHS